ncbi:MAG: ATP-binding cassette domain-containing protein, partial [Abditibacteriota bacterium]|nr:ATP-binding cassette domain-containing protein [Abditibacteriota bacterium]
NQVGLAHCCDAIPSQISGGEQQRAAIARALANKPNVLIADEPTGNLDPDTSLEIMRILEEANKDGTTVVVATHDRIMVDRMKKRVIQIDNGEIVRDETEGTYRSDFQEA